MRQKACLRSWKSWTTLILIVTCSAMLTSCLTSTVIRFPRATRSSKWTNGKARLVDHKVRATIVGDGTVGWIDHAAGLYVLHETELDAYIKNTAALEVIRASSDNNAKLVKQALDKAEAALNKD